MIHLVAKHVFDDVRHFAPKLKPGYDNYPTVAIRDPSSDKVREIEETEYCKRFRTSWSWFSLAKMVARFTLYNLKAGFMVAFNEPAYQVSQDLLSIRRIRTDTDQCFVMEDTTIPEDVIHGVCHWDPNQI